MDELAGKPNSRYQCPYYDEIKGLLEEKQINIYEYILPFVHKGSKATSFLQHLIFNTSYHQWCTLAGLEQIINHNTYMKRKYVEFYFPNNLKIQIQQLISCNNPNVLMIIKESNLAEDLKIYILNTLFCFSIAAKSVMDSIQAIYPFFFEAQQFFVKQNFIDKLLKDDLVLEKLYSITKLERGKSFEFSFSLMEADLIFYQESEPKYLFLGYNFSKTLDRKYKLSLPHLHYPLKTLRLASFSWGFYPLFPLFFPLSEIYKGKCVFKLSRSHFEKHHRVPL